MNRQLSEMDCGPLGQRALPHGLDACGERRKRRILRCALVKASFCISDRVNHLPCPGFPGIHWVESTSKACKVIR